MSEKIVPFPMELFGRTRDIHGFEELLVAKMVDEKIGNLGLRYEPEQSAA